MNQLAERDILNNKIITVNIGTELFADALRAQQAEAIQLAWVPPRKIELPAHLAETLEIMTSVEPDGQSRSIGGSAASAQIRQANTAVLELLQQADPYWIGMLPAIACVPGMREGLILHSGPPIAWEQMCETQKQGGINGILYEGYAANEAEARRLLETGQIEFASANDYHIVAPGSGIATPSMVVNIVEDRHTGICGFCAPFEGPNRGGLAGWGIYNPEIKKHLELVRTVIGPALGHVLAKAGGLALKRLIVRGVEMGDELHSRQDACGLLLINELMLMLVKSDLDSPTMQSCVDLLYGTTRFFHPLGMAAAMSSLEGVRQIANATIVTAMAGNGVEFGIKVAGTGNQWFTAPAPVLEGSLVSAQIGAAEVLPWIGDSCMLEAVGLGGCAAAAAPAVMRAQERTWRDGIARSREMAAITLARHDSYLIPALDYQGSPLGIDIRKVLQTGIEPVIHGGMISKGGKRLGAGIAHVPAGCFENAVLGYAEHYDLQTGRL